MKYKTIILLSACAAVGLLGPREAAARVSLPAVISDGMVLQGRAGVALWGWTDRQEEVSVVTSWDGLRYTAHPEPGGRWRVYVRTPEAGGPYELTFADGGTPVTLKDVVIGEVWLVSGQSNMEFSLARSEGAERAIAEATRPMIREFRVPRRSGEDSNDDAHRPRWVRSSPETAGSFSAVAFYFARTLQEARRVPVGIIHASWGGTPAEAWTPQSVLATDSRLCVALARWQAWERDAVAEVENEARELALFMTSRPHREPGVLFAGMIAPLVPYTVRGFLWYQGESNVRWAGEYEHLLATMICSWRERWRREQRGDPDLPFYIVELAPHGYSDMESASVLREAQWKVAGEVGHAGVVTTIDLGDMNDIHPTRKREIGERLARLALAKSYGVRTVHSGPAYRRAVVEGNRVRIHFGHTHGGLQALGAELSGFEISGRSEPTVFRPARARIEGRTVVAWSDEVPEPAQVRYAWGNAIAGYSLFNGAGLPAASFRTGSDPWVRRADAAAAQRAGGGREGAASAAGTADAGRGAPR